MHFAAAEIQQLNGGGKDTRKKVMWKLTKRKLMKIEWEEQKRELSCCTTHHQLQTLTGIDLPF